MEILQKRIYESFEKTDGQRVLADRLWPRGIKKIDAYIDIWAKEITPSTELRKWFHENRDAYSDFKKKYIAELKANKTAVDNFLKEINSFKKITLLTAAKEIEKSHIPILANFIGKQID